MNLLSAVIALFAASDAAPSSSRALDMPKTTSDTSCVDNASFSLNENPLHDCAWIMQNSNRRDNHCPIQEVRDNCPIACGLCCEDRADFLFEFPIGNDEDLKNCSWLLHNDKTQCLSEFNGIKMMYACPKSCNACQDPVPLEVQWVPKVMETRKEEGKGKPDKDSSDTFSPDQATNRVEKADVPPTTSYLSPAIHDPVTTKERKLNEATATNRVEKADATPASSHLSPTSQNLISAKERKLKKIQGDEYSSQETVVVDEELASSSRTLSAPMSSTVNQTSVPSVSPSTSKSPTQCSDDETYISPCNTNFGCELYRNTDCFMWGALLNDEHLQDVFTSCPVTCGVPCE